MGLADSTKAEIRKMFASELGKHKRQIMRDVAEVFDSHVRFAHNSAKQPPPNHGKKWSPEDREVLKKSFESFLHKRADEFGRSPYAIYKQLEQHCCDIIEPEEFDW
jgi:hypothetical protein